MNLFSKPGPLRALMEARGFTSEQIASIHANKKVSSMEFFFVDTTPLDKDFFTTANKLKLVAMFGVGLDHINMNAATEHGVLVTNVPGGNTRSVSELVFALMFDLAHRVTEMHISLCSGTWRRRLRSELAGKTLGVVGLGHIGQDVARIGKALGMTVIAANRTPRPDIAASLGIVQVPLETVLSNADYLSLHIPGGADSWHFGAAEFSRMKKGAFVINTARGDLLDLEALTRAITEKHLAGAGLDVFPQEPMDLTHPVFSLPQVIVTPHAGGTSKEALERVCASCLDEVARVLRKERSPNAKNAAVYNLPFWQRS